MTKDPREFVPEPYQFQMDEAVGVVSCTTLGAGNCFAVRTEDGKHYDVVNFYLDDNFFDKKKGLETLLKEGCLTWPVKIAILAGRTAVINDERIPDEHYRSRFCEVCCPPDLLPVHQRLAKARAIAKGTTSFIQAEAWDSPWGKMPAMVIESTTITAK
jgi:hypothetical protein